MPTQIGSLGVTFPDNTVQTTAAIAGGAGFGGAPNASIYTATGFWICPPGIFKVRATVVGGGGGGYSAVDAGFFIGGTGGCAIGVYAVTPGTSYNVVVGTGGPGFAPPFDQPNPSSPGNTSSFGSFCSATGGAAAQFNQGVISPGVDGYGINGNVRNLSSCVGISSLSGPNPRTVVSSSPVLWNVGANYAAGSAGLGSSGGSGGAVMIEWWG